MRNPDRVFLDVMSYSETQIPAPDSFDSQADLISYLQDANPQLRGNSIRAMVGSSTGQQSLSEGVEKVPSKVRGGRKRLLPKSQFVPGQKRVIKQELKRKPRARKIDESRTVKDKRRLLNINQDNVRRWKRDPSRFDLRGIDTKTHGFINRFVREKRTKWKGEGRRVFNDRGLTYFVVRKDKQNRVFAQNIITGKRVPKAVYSRKGTLKKLERRGKI